MKRNHILLITTVSALVVGSAIIIGTTGMAALWGRPDNISAQAPNACAPESMDSFRSVGYSDVQLQESSLPAGNRIEAIEYNGADLLKMYIADRSICQPEDLRTEIDKGTIIVEVANVPELADEEQEFSQTLKNLNEQVPQMKATPTKINGHSAIIWDQYLGSDRTIIGDKTVREEPLSMPAGLMIWDAKAHKGYHISGMTTAEELRTLAEGLSLSQ